MTPNEILANIQSDVRDHQSVGVVFDLDSTLFCVSPRSQAILRELADEEWFQRQFPDASRVLKTIEVQKNQYGVKEALARAGLIPTKDLAMAVRDYWRERFFSNSHLRHDLIYPGAEVFVNQVHQAGAQVYYLTGRSEYLMRKGTLENLKNWKFPQIPEERVIMKARSVDTDENYKESRLRALATQFARIWFFENEPVIIHQVRKAFPDIQIVYIDSAHSGKANPPTDLATLRMDFTLTTV